MNSCAQLQYLLNLYLLMNIFGYFFLIGNIIKIYLNTQQISPSKNITDSPPPPPYFPGICDTAYLICRHWCPLGHSNTRTFRFITCRLYHSLYVYIIDNHTYMYMYVQCSGYIDFYVSDVLAKNCVLLLGNDLKWLNGLGGLGGLGGLRASV